MKKLIFLNCLSGDSKLYTIEDEAKAAQYYIEETKSLPTQQAYKVRDSNKKKIGKIEKKRYSFGLFNLPRYHIKTEAGKIDITKEMKQFKEEYEIQGEGLSIKGNWLSNDFRIYQNDALAAHVLPYDAEGQDGYLVEVLAEEKEALIVCFMAVICWIHNQF